MKKPIAIAATLIAGLIITGQARAVPNLVSNSGFETGDFTDWTQGGNTGGTGVGDDLIVPVHSGNFAAAFGPVENPGTLTQTLNTTAGATYTVDFFLGVGVLFDEDEVTPAAFVNNEFIVQFNGVTLATLDDVPDQDYVEYTYSGTASSGSTTDLEFQFVNNPDWFFLDDITVTPAIAPIAGVPEPVTATLGLLGLGGLGLATLRRRAR